MSSATTTSQATATNWVALQWTSSCLHRSYSAMDPSSLHQISPTHRKKYTRIRSVLSICSACTAPATDTHAICYKKPATNLSSDQMGTMIFTQKREGFALLVTCDRRQGRIRLTRGKLGQTGHETRPFSPPSSPPTRELSVPHARAARPGTWAPR